MLAAHPRALTLSAGQASDPGPKTTNQDAVGSRVPTGRVLGLKGAVFAVADGISTAAKSQDAARYAVDRFLEAYYSTPEIWTPEASAKTALAQINAALFQHNRHLDDLNRGKVCTFSAVILCGKAGHILHAGDSRVLRLRAAGLEVLTRDHRLETADGHTYLSRALGLGETLDIDYGRAELAPGDIFFVTTDGVHDPLRPQHFVDASSDGAMAEVPDRLIAAALTLGGDDNMSVHAIKVEALPDQAARDLWPEIMDLPLPGALDVGSRLDGFTIRRCLYQSARSHVYLATDKDGRRFALKVPASDLIEDQNALRRFMLTDWITNQVASPHLVKVAPCSETRTALYSVSHYLDGQTLRQWMTDTPKASLDRVRSIAAQVVDGLRVLHRSGIVHQDVRPENIMIDGHGSVVLIDLGSASVAGVEMAAPGILGALAGTYQYTAPEYLSGGQVSWRSDQFSLAVILYEMLTGRLPYGQAVARVTNQLDQNRLTYRTARDDKNGVPIWLDRALQKAVHPDPLQRYDALSEFLEDLRRPNPSFASNQFVPLATRHPVAFWKTTALIFALIAFALAFQLLHRHP